MSDHLLAQENSRVATHQGKFRQILLRPRNRLEKVKKRIKSPDLTQRVSGIKRLE